MAAGDVTFLTLYFGEANPVSIDAATASGANSGTTDNNKQIVMASVGNNVLIVQVLIATA